jgi:hypothetical protein
MWWVGRKKSTYRLYDQRRHPNEGSQPTRVPVMAPPQPPQPPRFEFLGTRTPPRILGSAGGEAPQDSGGWRAQTPKNRGFRGAKTPEDSKVYVEGRRAPRFEGLRRGAKTPKNRGVWGAKPFKIRGFRRAKPPSFRGCGERTPLTAGPTKQTKSSNSH